MELRLVGVPFLIPMIAKKMQPNLFLARLDGMGMVIDRDPLGQHGHQHPNQPQGDLPPTPRAPTEKLDQGPLPRRGLPDVINIGHRLPTGAEDHAPHIGIKQQKILTSEQIPNMVYYGIEQGQCFHDDPPLFGLRM